MLYMVAHGLPHWEDPERPQGAEGDNRRSAHHPMGIMHRSLGKFDDKKPPHSANVR